VLRWWVNRDLTPSDPARAAIARTPARHATATLKVCHDAEGRITSRRIVHPSGVAAFDAEVLAYFRSLDQLEPYQPGGQPAAACSILAVRYPDVLGGHAREVTP
jgi:TonB family protein